MPIGYNTELAEVLAKRQPAFGGGRPVVSEVEPF